LATLVLAKHKFYTNISFRQNVSKYEAYV